MRKKNPIDIKSIRKSMRTGVLLVIVAALTLEATSLIQNYFAQESLREEAFNNGKVLHLLILCQNCVMSWKQAVMESLHNSHW